jgi:hypothetical protein
VATNKEELSIVIEAINNASKQLKQIEDDLKDLSDTQKKGGKSAEEAALGFTGLTGSIAGGILVAETAKAAFGTLRNTIAGVGQSILDIAMYSSEVEGLGIAMKIVANNAGITAEEVTKVRDSVVEQNVTTQAANRLMTDLIRNQLDYVQATELAAAAQNIAVASGRDSSETIERISHAISSGNTFLLKQIGLTEHVSQVYERYAQEVEKTSSELTEMERKQAVVNYVIQEGEKYAGAYGAAMENAAKKMRSTSARIEEVRYGLGQALGPALYEIVDGIYDFVNSVVDFVNENEAAIQAIGRRLGVFAKQLVRSIKSFIRNIPWDWLLKAMEEIIYRSQKFSARLKVLANYMQIFARAVIQGVRTLKSFGEAMTSLIRGDFSKLKDVYTDWRGYSENTLNSVIGDIYDIKGAYENFRDAERMDLKEWWDKMGEIDADGWQDRLSKHEEGYNQMSAQQQKAYKDMLEKIEEENEKYAKAIKQRTEDFQEQFDDLIIKHRDTIEQLTEDIEEEKQDYAEKVAEMKENYKDRLEDMEERHKEKTESIKDDMEEERRKAEEEIEKLKKAYEEEYSLIEKEGEDRLSNLKTQLDKEKALGDNANKDKIKVLEDMIAKEEKELDETLQDKKDKHQEEVDDVNEKLDDKLDDLKEELQDEIDEYQDKLDDVKDIHAEELADAKEMHQDKLDDLQEKLDEELAIQEKYADDFARLKDAVVKDDITRLVEKHEKEMAKMEEDHNDRVAKIKEDAFSEGQAFNESFASGMASTYPQVKNEFDRFSTEAIQAKQHFEGLIDTASIMLPGLKGVLKEKGWWGEGFLYQKGGLATRPGIVGESGPEVVLPLDFPNRMAMIMNSMGIGGGGGNREVVQNFYVTVNNQQDAEMLMERAGFAMEQGGVT